LFFSIAQISLVDSAENTGLFDRFFKSVLSNHLRLNPAT
jgi:hypothetical protein